MERRSHLSVAFNYDPGATGTGVGFLQPFSSNPLIESIIIANTGTLASRSLFRTDKLRTVNEPLWSGPGMAAVLNAATTSHLLLLTRPIAFSGRGIERMLNVASDCGAALVFSDYFDQFEAGLKVHSLIDYQPGSIRDGFDFGAAMLLSAEKCNEALQKHGRTPAELNWGAFYDLRLKLSSTSEIVRIPEPLYTVATDDRGGGTGGQFEYLDPKRRDYEIEMETIVTSHLKRIGAYLPPEFARLPEDNVAFSVAASIIIPVRNRARTISDAVASAVSQQTDFAFNVIVVDNHSTDGTTGLLRQMAADEPRLVHLIPGALDLGIGGCWNEAIYSDDCGRYAVQLDSDDIYKDSETLQKIVDKFREGPYAMVIGSYKITNFDLREIPPGLIDHREWTDDNGRNNALRINGLGAPRAFYVPLLRQLGLPNTSYGEDYAVALRITRDYPIGRIFEPLYYARRWEGNSDAKLDLETANRYDTYKDRLRTLEIMARQRKNAR
ncbi:MAG TPA: glycosyltransferase family 2 protein [Blastocatellia bacterium]